MLVTAGMAKLIIFKKQTHALYPWVRGKDKEAPGSPLMIQGFVFFLSLFIFVCTYLFKARDYLSINI